MSRTKRRTKNIDLQTHVHKLYWGEHLMYTYRGVKRYDSLQDMYDSCVAERDTNVRKYHTDAWPSYWCHNKIKERVRLCGARSIVRQTLHKAMIEGEFDDISFDKEGTINKRAIWWG